MKIDPATWLILSKLLDEWLDLPPDSRSDWLANLGAEYSDVLPTLRELLASREIADTDSLETIAKFDDSSPDLYPGQRLGPFRILSTIGRGGVLSRPAEAHIVENPKETGPWRPHEGRVVRSK